MIVFTKWQKFWQATEGPEAHKAIKPADWEALLMLMAEYNVGSVLEFGAGLSTILFSQLKHLYVKTFETNKALIDRLIPNAPLVDFVHWDNKTHKALQIFDLALVDGILPRAPQATMAIASAGLIAIHDPGCSGRDAIEVVKHLPEIPQSSPYMKVFQNDLL